MASAPPPSIPSGKPRDTDGFWASDLDGITAGMIFVVVISAGVAQLLDRTHAISLSMTLQLTMWLVVLGLIVLLSIAYMICRTYLTAKKSEAQHIGELIAAAGVQVAAAVRANAQPDGANAATGQPETPTGPTAADAEQKLAAVPAAKARLDRAVAESAAAEQEAETARARAAEAKRAVERREADAEQKRAAVRGAVVEAEARLAEAVAVEVTDWQAKVA